MRKFIFQEYEKLTNRGEQVKLAIEVYESDGEIVDVVTHSIIPNIGLAITVAEDDAFEDKVTFVIPAKSSEVRTHSGSLYGDLRFVLPEVDEDSLPIEKVTAKRYNTLFKGRTKPSFVVRRPDGNILPITKHQIALDQFLILSVEDSSVNMICDLKTGSVKNIETHEHIGELEFELQKKTICAVTFDYKYQDGIWVRTMLGDYVTSTQPDPAGLLDLICDELNLTKGEYEDNVRNIKITELEESYEIKYTHF